MRFETREVKLSKKGSRQVSPFIAKELMYDYLMGHLDAERASAVQKSIAQDPNLQKEIEKLKLALVYSENLKKTELSDEFLKAVNEPDTYLSILFKKTQFDRWPIGIKWALEAGIVLSVFLVVLFIFPWARIYQMGVQSAQQSFILAEFKKPELSDVSNLANVEKKEAGSFIDEGIHHETPPLPPSTVDPKKLTAENPPAKMPTKSETPLSAVATTPPVGEEKKKPVEGGSLYRGRLMVTNSPVIGQKIKDQIIAIGGRKAGEVELGWERSAGVYYFHFTVPESRYEELKNFFNSEGQLRISKEKHPRVMPDGIIRLIVTVEEANK